MSHCFRCPVSHEKIEACQINFIVHFSTSLRELHSAYRCTVHVIAVLYPLDFVTNKFTLKSKKLLFIRFVFLRDWLPHEGYSLFGG